MIPNADVVEPMTDCGSAIVMTCWVETIGVAVGTGVGATGPDVGVGVAPTGVAVGVTGTVPLGKPFVPLLLGPQAAKTAAQPTAARKSTERCGDMRYLRRGALR